MSQGMPVQGYLALLAAGEALCPEAAHYAVTGPDYHAPDVRPEIEAYTIVLNHRDKTTGIVAGGSDAINAALLVRELDEVEQMKKMCELKLLSAAPDPEGGFTFMLEAAIIPVLAHGLYELLQKKEAPNFLEYGFHTPVPEEMIVVTVQRVMGLTPSQKLTASEERNATLRGLVSLAADTFDESAERLTNVHTLLSRELADHARTLRGALGE